MPAKQQQLCKYTVHNQSFILLFNISPFYYLNAEKMHSVGRRTGNFSRISNSAKKNKTAKYIFQLHNFISIWNEKTKMIDSSVDENMQKRQIYKIC